jgi:hypothetical protein
MNCKTDGNPSLFLHDNDWGYQQSRDK